MQVSREDRLNWLMRPFSLAAWLCVCSMLLAADLWRRGASPADILPALLIAMTIIGALLFWGLLRLTHASRR